MKLICLLIVWLNIQACFCRVTWTRSSSLARSEPEVKTVHIVPHSHDDLGWLKTVDEYFYGTRKDIMIDDVKAILDTVLEALKQDSKRKFMQVETKFLAMWWEQLEEEQQEDYKKLVQNGQIELVSGGWSMHDEACPTFDDMIDNMEYGHRYLEKLFGKKPRIGWQIDTFGHSQTNTRLFAEMGFDANFVVRVDHDDRARRMKDKELEFVWRPAADTLGTDVSVLTHIMYYHYKAPDGFNFDVRGRERWVVDRNSSLFNADEMAEKFIEYLHQNRSAFYRTNHFLVPFGDDFNFMDASQNYESMDNMIAYMNEHHGDRYHFRYSTPSEYVDALAELDVEWPTNYHDMLPIRDTNLPFWTGFFTSRPALKALDRHFSHFTRFA